MAILTSDEIDARLEEVKNIKFILDDDPTVKGLSSINMKLAEIQGMKNRVCAMVMEAMRNFHEAEINRDVAQNKHDRQMQLLIVTDDEVKAQKSVDARREHAGFKMKDLVAELFKAENALTTAGWYLKALQLVSSNLDSANGNLSRQITVIDHSITIGELPSVNRQPITGQMKTFNS